MKGRVFFIFGWCMLLAAIGIVISLFVVHAMLDAFPSMALWVVGLSGLVGGALGLILGAAGKLAKTKDSKGGKTQKV